MNKRVYGVLGIASIMSNWNADFSGFPKTTSDGSVFGSDKALKYPIKKMWENEGKKVLYIKSMRFSKNKKNEITLVPRSLKERYEQLFAVEDLKKSSNSKQVLTNLLTAIDVKNFGATFAEEGNNISITGAVQIGQGFNEYKYSTADEQQILSPFRNSNGENESNDEAKKNSTLGTKIVSKEAHYFYPFSINPMAYKELVELGVTTGYTNEDYQEFKRASLVSATAYATNAKSGCENEFALFVETASDTYLPNLASYISFEKPDNGKNIIYINCDEILNSLEDNITSVEIYYNQYSTELKHNINNVKVYDIITQEEV